LLPSDVTFTTRILNKCLLSIVGENSVLQKRPRIRRTKDNDESSRRKRISILS